MNDNLLTEYIKSNLLTEPTVGNPIYRRNKLTKAYLTDLMDYWKLNWRIKDQTDWLNYWIKSNFPEWINKYSIHWLTEWKKKQLTK